MVVFLLAGQRELENHFAGSTDFEESEIVARFGDDDAICPLCDPPLSSVRPDAQGVGHRAAEILQEMINGVPHDSRLELIARVKQLLAETSLLLEQLAPLAGYDCKELPSAVFKWETGETPGAFRRRRQSSGSPD